MIHARKDRWATALLFWYVHRLFRKRFAAVRLSGGDERLAGEEGFPVVLFSNHETWWDGFFEIPLFVRYRLHYYIMMNEPKLRRFWFFQRTGVFGVDLDSAAGRSQSLLYAARLLRKPPAPRTALVIYPHGRLLQPFEPRPPFEPGLSALARLVPEVRFIPVGRRIVFREDPKPEVFIQVGAPVPGAVAASPGTLEAALEDTLGSLELTLARGEADDWTRVA